MDIHELIAKKLSRELNGEEEKIFQKWLNSSNEHKQSFSRIQDYWQGTSANTSIKGKESIYSKILIRISEEAVPLNIQEGKKNTIWRSTLKYAAILIFFIVSAIVISKFVSFQRQLISQDQVELIEKSNPKGQKSQIILPDGSRVYLNSESVIKYKSDFRYNRQIFLEGEAFFNVVRDTLNPFTIDLGNTQVNVLGTSFNITAYPDRASISVAVASGEIAVIHHKSSGEKMTENLTSLQFVEVNQDGPFIKSMISDPNEFFAWREGKLIFKKASLEQVIYKLEKWYDVEFSIENKDILIAGFTGTYDNETLEIVLDGMAFTSNFNYVFDGKKVILK